MSPWSIDEMWRVPGIPFFLPQCSFHFGLFLKRALEEIPPRKKWHHKADEGLIELTVWHVEFVALASDLHWGSFMCMCIYAFNVGFFNKNYLVFCTISITARFYFPWNCKSYFPLLWTGSSKIEEPHDYWLHVDQSKQASCWQSRDGGGVFFPNEWFSSSSHSEFVKRAAAVCLPRR